MKRGRQIALYESVSRRSARHGDDARTVEFVAQLLALLPREELGERHRFADGDVHEGSSTKFRGGPRRTPS
jgi:hypothetical protein